MNDRTEASNPDTSPARLTALANSPDTLVLRLVGRHPKAPLNLRLALASHGKWRARWGAAESPLPPATVARLTTDPRDTVRWAALSNPVCPAAALAAAAKTPRVPVDALVAIARNPNTPRPTRLALAGHSDPTVAHEATARL